MSSETASPSLRSNLSSGNTLLGTFVKLPALETIDISAIVGWDFVVVDLEHSQLDEATCRLLVRHARAVGLPTLVRVASVDAGQINRLLEAGVCGIQLSTVRSGAELAALRLATHYAPQGRRSVSLSHPVARYGANSLRQYLAEQHDGPLLVGQIETATTETPITELARLLDVVFLGTMDLSVDMRHPGDLSHREIQARIAEVAVACREAGSVLGSWVSAPADVEAAHAFGSRYLVAGSDVQFLRERSAEFVSHARMTTRSNNP